MKRCFDRQLALRLPELFRHELRVRPQDDQRFRERIQDWQRGDYEALDAAWCEIAGLPGAWRAGSAQPQPTGPARVYRRAYIERPRGHSKTFDMAVQIAWILQAARHPVRGLVAAADKEQAGLLHASMLNLAKANPDLTADLAFFQQGVENPRTRSRLQLLSSDVASSWGHDPDFVVCDELCHWTREEMWYSLASSAAKRAHCLLIVLTNAGIGRDWHWQVRETARTSERWYFSSLNGPQAPWIGPEQLAEQRKILPPPMFERLWLNVWQHSDGEFVTLAEAQACRDDSLFERERGEPGRQYVGAIDYAEKHDYTVGCVCHREQDRIVVDRMDVVRPTPTKPTSVRWVDAWMRRMARDFTAIRFIVDAYQLLSVIQELSGLHDVRRFEFTGGRGNHALAITLRNLITERRVAWYAGCGHVPDSDAYGGADDNLEAELASLRLRQSNAGLIRIDHVNDGRHHDDRAFTLGAACLELLEVNPAADFLDVSLPGADGGFRW